MAAARFSRLTITVGGLLVLLGIAAFVGTAFASITALIPAIFGFLFMALGAVAREPAYLRPAGLAIGVLAALGVLGSLRGLPDIITLATGGTPASPIAAVAQGGMIIACLAVLGALVRDRDALR